MSTERKTNKKKSKKSNITDKDLNLTQSKVPKKKSKTNFSITRWFSPSANPSKSKKSVYIELIVHDNNNNNDDYDEKDNEIIYFSDGTKSRGKRRGNLAGKTQFSREKFPATPYLCNPLI